LLTAAPFLPWPASPGAPIAGLVAAAIAGAACATVTGDRGPVVRRDSAGVEIVENRSPAAAPAWNVPDSPLVSVGGRPGDPGHDLNRVTSAHRFPDGRLLVADGASAEVRLFDSTGGFVRAIGRSGGGPGEFQEWVRIVAVRGDSLLTVDGGQRLSAFDDRGTFARSFRLERTEAQGYAAPVGWLATGDLIAEASEFRTDLGAGDRYRMPFRSLRYRADGTYRDRLLEVPGLEVRRVEMSEGGQKFLGEDDIEFGRRAVYAIAADRIYLGTDDRFEIAGYDGAGALKRLIRVDEPPAPVGEADKAAQIERNLEPIRQWRQASDAMRAEAEARVRNDAFSERFPFYESFLVADDGRLWVQRFQRPTEDARHFVVFDSSGALVATARLPDRVRPMHIGIGLVVGRWRDPDDVELVRVYPIR
jgi:hypothetical protein